MNVFTQHFSKLPVLTNIVVVLVLQFQRAIHVIDYSKFPVPIDQAM